MFVWNAHRMHANYQKLEDGHHKTETEPALHIEDWSKISFELRVHIFLTVITIVVMLILSVQVDSAVCLLKDEDARLSALLIYNGSE